jgi:hypothetical protein
MAGVAGLLVACALGGGTEEARWWIGQGVTIEPSTTSFDVRVAYVSCTKSQMESDAIEGYSVTYDEEAVTVSIVVRLPDGFAGGWCAQRVGGEPVMTIVLDEPLGNRMLMVRRGTGPPKEATVYNF